jgi:hypothetical protein
VAARTNGVSTILLATIVAGIAGYFVTWLVFRQVGASTYAQFAIFWAALYLVIGSVSGIQHEIARANRPIEPVPKPAVNRARNFAVIAAFVMLAVISLSSFLWGPSVFGRNWAALAAPLAVGVAFYVLVAALSGVLYGIEKWRPLALMIASDGLIRVALLLIALLFTKDVVAFAWVVAIPFPLALAVVWPIIRRGAVGQSQLDVGYRGLSWNVARTILASASTAILVSGFPLLLGVAAKDESQVLLGQMIFTITLARAPLIVTIMSLQGLLTVRFRNNAHSWARTFLLVQAIIIGGAVVFGIGGALFGQAIFSWFAGESIQLSGGFIAMLVGSSALVGALCVSGAAVLARSQHFIYSAGWVLAAFATIVGLALPIGFFDRVTVALIAGPIVGLITHLLWLVIARPGKES